MVIEMDRLHALGSATGALRAKGVATEAIIASRESVAAGDFDRGKPVGAVVAAVKVLRTLHASERPLNASEVARAAALHRGTAYNILRTLQAEGFVAYDFFGYLPRPFDGAVGQIDIAFVKENGMFRASHTW